jgi:hypothetical protein
MSTYSRDLATTRFDWRANAADLADLYRLAGPREKCDRLQFGSAALARPGVHDVIENQW